MKRVVYPFAPKSSTTLVPGQFWSIPLSSGRFGCGRVVQLPGTKFIGSSRTLLAGLMDWIGAAPPTAESIAGAGTLIQGEAHIRTILSTGGEILGWRALEDDRIEPGFFCSQSEWSGCELKRGFQTLRRISMEEFRRYPVFSSWGYAVMGLVAENLDRDPEGTRKVKRDHSTGKTGGPFPRLGEEPD